MEIRDVDPQGAEAMALLREASQEARALYPELFSATDAPATNEPLPARGAYVVACVDGRPLACGALRPRDETTAELRRIYVLREHRRQGLASAVLTHLIDEARRLGYGRLVLETGHRQVAAMRLYEAHGLLRIPPFGEYTEDAGSVCYERNLGADAAPESRY